MFAKHPGSRITAFADPGSIDCAEGNAATIDALVERFSEAAIADDADELSLLSLARENAGLFSGPADLAHTLLGGAARTFGDYWLEDSVDFVAVTLAMHRLTCLLMLLEDEPARFGFPPCPMQAEASPRGTVALMTASGDQHGFGLSMLSYRLRHAGWRVLVAGDRRTLYEAVAFHKPQAIGLSVAHSDSVCTVVTLMRDLRARFAPRRLNIAVGGSAFATDESLHDVEGADLVGQSAEQMLAWLDSCDSVALVASPASGVGNAPRSG